MHHQRRQFEYLNGVFSIMQNYSFVAIWHLDETVSIIIFRLGPSEVLICCYLVICPIYFEGGVFICPKQINSFEAIIL